MDKSRKHIQIEPLPKHIGCGQYELTKENPQTPRAVQRVKTYQLGAVCHNLRGLVCCSFSNSLHSCILVIGTANALLPWQLDLLIL
jgi:hypothetical protein